MAAGCRSHRQESDCQRKATTHGRPPVDAEYSQHQRRRSAEAASCTSAGGFIVFRLEYRAAHPAMPARNARTSSVRVTSALEASLRSEGPKDLAVGRTQPEGGELIAQRSE